MARLTLKTGLASSAATVVATARRGMAERATTRMARIPREWLRVVGRWWRPGKGGA
jgi:hypothetical protein